ncbi:putative histidine kinase [Methanocella paludicola SANAE]|uniref:histidine kinase n=1 Tax=Methanocella paludicola (strain DSM 17711 / JCM 13418 / NBRC 101707 / SANAE) TaxID=304371 RepID=D1YWK3_METPS|nr:putative histidine kinase [Methanocella paludicola SANAE]
MRESEAHLAKSQELAHIGSWSWDIDKDRLQWSDETYRIWGLKPGEIEPNYEFYMGFVHPDDREMVQRAVDNALNGGVYNVDYRIVRRDGSIRFIHSEGEVMFDSQGKPVKIVGTGQDVTERKQAEEALRESETKFRQMAENINSVFWISEITGTTGLKYVYMSPAFEQIFGIQVERIYDDPLQWLKMIYPEDREGFMAAMKKRFAGDYFNVEVPDFRIVRPDGTIRWIKARLYPIKGEDGTIRRFVGLADDVTERKLAEDALKLTQFALDNFRDSAIWISLDGSIVYVNQETCNSLGYSKEELLSMHIWDIDPDYSQDKFQGLWRETYQQGYAVKFESEHVARNGRAFPVEVTSCYTRYGDKEYLITFDRDITERKRAENALLESEKKFRVLAETSPAAIFLYQGEKYVYVNPMAETLTGYSKDELLAGDAWEWIHPEFQELVKGRARKRQLGEKLPGQYEVKYRARDGREGWVDFAAGLIDYEGKPAGLAMAFDVTKRKQAEETLNRDRYILAKSQETAHVGNWALDLQTGEITCSAENYRIFGYPPDEAKPTLEWVISRVLPDDRRMLADFMEARTKDGKWGSIDYRIVRPDGSVRSVNTIVDKAVRDKAGNVKRLYGISQDVTERKKTEKELAEAKAQAELYLDLMGHDINNLHQVALGYLELARDMPAGEEQAVFLDKPVEVLQRSAQLIQNVRKLQKLHDGVFRTEVVDVCKLLVDVRREFGGVPYKQVTLNLNGCERCLVRANDLLHDVFANLVSNAIKHTGDRTNIVVNLDIVEENGGRCCRVRVEDDGPGIPEDLKGKIFNRALMGTGKAKGMGLGLYLVKSLVDSYGGRVWVEDRVKGDHTKGARFIVLLPSAEK